MHNRNTVTDEILNKNWAGEKIEEIPVKWQKQAGWKLMKRWKVIKLDDGENWFDCLECAWEKKLSWPSGSFERN